jgi:hypothetical protein
MVDRSTIYGNQFSSKSGLYTREQAIAKHRVWLYTNLVNDPHYFARLKEDLLGKDLVCWCKHDKVFKGCHADNYKHVLSEEFIGRDYSKSVIHYLMSDLRSALNKLSLKISKEIPEEKWLNLFIFFCDMKLEISSALMECKTEELDLESIANFISRLVVDLESSLEESKVELIDYWMDHALWLAYDLFSPDDNKSVEPIHPSILLKKPKLKK